MNPDAALRYRLDMNQLDLKEMPYRTEESRALARYGQQNVIIDWQSPRDENWRTNNQTTMEQRIASLIKLLNSDLGPLKSSILRCVGYLNRSQNPLVIGIVFCPPSDVTPGQGPIDLDQIFTRAKSRSDVPSLGERFELAKALVSTIFEMHNFGWTHKDIQPKNILFWPKPGTKGEWDTTKPYLVGFDVSESDQIGESAEDTLSKDNLYRHPALRGSKSTTFQPSFDMFSLGVILFEIGMWRSVSTMNPRSFRTNPSPSDPMYIDKTLRNGPLSDLAHFTGDRYQNAVWACLCREFDRFWEEQGVSQQTRLENYLGAVQSKVVDAIACCSV